MKIKLCFFAFLLLTLEGTASDVACKKLLAETITLFSQSRVPYNGLYLDRLSLISTTNPDVVSISATGVGLLSEVIAWKTDKITYYTAVAHWKQTINTLLENQDIQLSRVAGYYTHFCNTKGVKQNLSENSTVDNAILMMCLFWGAAKLQDSEISLLVEKIYKQIDWTIATSSGNGIYRSISPDGKGQNISSSFNEYCLVANLSYLAAGQNGLQQKRAFDSFFPSKNSSIPRFNYSGIDLISDGSSYALSSFVPQFSWFFSPALRNELIPEILNYQKADSTWFALKTNSKKWNYGLSAGSGYPDSYSANRINVNPSQIVSPSTIAGYIPAVPYSSQILDSMLQYNVGRYKIPGTADSILWRYSLSHGNFAKEVQLIDMTGMLLGTAFKAGFDFSFSVPEIVHPNAVGYQFINFSNVSDIELAPDSSIFIVKSIVFWDSYGDSLWHIKGDTFKNIQIPHNHNSIYNMSISRTAIFLACSHFLYKIPLSNLSSIETLDSWGWDQFTNVKVKSGVNGKDSLLFYINFWGSRSGWWFMDSNSQQRSLGFPGHLEKYGFFDAASDSTIYIYNQRYNLNDFTSSTILPIIKYAFKVKGKSLLISTNTSFSTDYGNTWTEFVKPFNLPNISPSGFVQINDETLAFSDNSLNKIILIQNGKMYPTSTKVPANFVLKVFDGKYLWGTCSGELVKIEFANYKIANYVMISPLQQTLNYNSEEISEKFQVISESRYGTRKFMSSDSAIASVDQNGLVTVHKGGKVSIKVYCDEIRDTAYTEAFAVLSINWNLAEYITICADKSYNGWTQPGTYLQYLKTNSGLDSTVTTHLTVNPLPNPSGIISGFSTVCNGQGSVFYSVPIITNATSYFWTLPFGASGSSSTNTITVNYGISAVSGNIKVKGHNDCGDGAESSLPVTVIQIPPIPTITNIKPITFYEPDSTVLISSATIGNHWYKDGIPLSGVTAKNITIKTSGIYTVSASNGNCTSNQSSSVTVTMKQDKNPPVSSVLALTAIVYVDSVLVKWSGTDPESGIKDYSIFVSENGSTWSTWLSNTTRTEAYYKGKTGKNYYFYSLAHDKAGNSETKTGSEAQTWFPLTVNISKKWDDVLVCNNSATHFTIFQWYKNDQPIVGATKQFYQELGGLNGSYYLIATNPDGTRGRSNVTKLVATAKSINVFPNPTGNRQEFNVTINALETDMEHAKLSIISLTGQVIVQRSVIQQQMKLSNLPTGIYIVQVVFSNGELLTKKLEVKY